ncbi:hypothetical protein A3742_04695 [Oleiphilus sp. HI0071]|uniref:DUF2288 domain-containing protein n=1 Tax=unclassified Oleiphilus TaxID=2631174 RepID=UPI0007C37F5F|nr:MULTISPECIES: DUF2288 domain-containing protein [unclassified Oleiphilus]KZY63742.1 hypothetical protein A3737_03395 [Oleiphilus sp. HI0065]KZY86482.1 hypothetical protein A3742_04695 [Oleiphilus sp. HI0071]KZY92176.1 hypothetical protein A3744_14875 [Oleiphilus sp. HI0073]KZZ51403.1 hypothetical protein A3760_12850 [Oleiphilus sp. HI0122]KZZ51524.1 hypothetical protein A3758_11950 [Oleiphilus sp. HI0118]KZZ70748.1 hypothetical protein A3765_02915 [Oleiphilus sp. HI0130]KZZ79730.1 hypothe
MTSTQDDNKPQVPLATKLNLETAQISWKELEPHFAGGNVIAVDKGLDLLLVAEQIVADNTDIIKQWMSEGKVAQVADDQALSWSNDNALLWAVVIKPWILVQQR